MIRIHSRALGALLCLVISAPLATAVAQSPAPAAAAPVAAQSAESRKLKALFDEYFEELLQREPILATSIGDPRYNDRFVVGIAPAERASREKFERAWLARIQQVDPAQLAGQDLLSYQIFKRDRQEEIEAMRFPDHLMPLNQFYSTPNFFAQLGSGDGMQPFVTVQDYDNFLKRIDGFAAWTDQAIVNMREGIRQGYTLPAILVERTLPQLGAHVVPKAEDSLYWGPIRKMPESFPVADRERLTAAYRSAIDTKIVPSYRKLQDFMRDEYLPKARGSHGMQGLPQGKDWYAFNLRTITTTGYTPEQIHQLGLDEVKRIHGEMKSVMDRVGFEGTLQEFFKYLNSDPKFTWDSREALVAGYVDIKKRVDPQLPKLFEIFPRADYEVRAVEPFREKSAAGGMYSPPSEDGSRAGIFYANTYDLRARPKWAMEALSLHEGNPGHHFQIAIQMEQENLPRFRRYGRYTSYVEGWGLYAESLGGELGLYTDPYQYFGRLEGELWRAIRLVVDTGLHAKGWTREQVLEYMNANSSAAEARRVSEAERYMAIPGQATAYKVGQIKISELRARSEKELGSKFDIRKFHTAVLIDGALPLDVLEAKVDRWIASQR
jgi:uncharacterized protein (DUF885 family)